MSRSDRVRRRGAARSLLAVVVAAGVVLAACGSDDAASDAASRPGSVATTSERPGEPPDPTTSAVDADPFPVTIEHKYGTTTIDDAPERVVSVGFTDQDAVLALGVVPVGIRNWYGDEPDATWPWAQPLLHGAHPTVLSADSINFEAVAALRPDLIVGVSSGMTEEEYTKLSAIAPTITQSGDFIDYGTPWQDATVMIGTALGKRAEAEQLVDVVEQRFADARREHPDFGGATGVIAYTLGNGTVGGYAPADVRGQLMTNLGFDIPRPVVERAGDRFYAEFSTEEMDQLDADAIVWVTDDAAILAALQSDPVHAQLDATEQGREVFIDSVELSGAASFSSVVSLPYVLDWLVPRLAAAVDGDPATAVP